MTGELNVSAAARPFEIDGEFIEAEPYGSGHINDTYRYLSRMAARRFATSSSGSITTSSKTLALMENVERVTAHLATNVAEEPDSSRRALRLIPTRDGRAWHVDAEGNHWRAYRFIEKAHTYDAVESTEQAFQAGRAFGRFQQQLAGLPAPRLHDTIPDFHHTPRRFSALEQAIAADTVGRASAGEGGD